MEWLTVEVPIPFFLHSKTENLLGFELALACDIIIAAKSASFCLPEPRVGLAALAAGPIRLVRTVGT